MLTFNLRHNAYDDRHVATKRSSSDDAELVAG
jgi:hypothetical protein